MKRFSPCDESRFDSIKCLLLDMAGERTLDVLLDLVVRRLHALSGVALARIWLIEPGDLCEVCRMRDECPDQTSCLHLVASAGVSLDGSESWAFLDGRFRRFPVGVRKVGHIAATREPVEVCDIDERSHWIADPAWAKREGIRGFVGRPLLYRDQVLGVLGVFLRSPVDEDAQLWLQMLADHTASAVANARAFEKIEELRSQLALENEYLRDEVKDATGCCGGIIGDSPALRKVLEQVSLVAPTESTTLILGESGVGKELIARALHDNSPRRDGPLIKVNCASIPRELFESEFFGHVQGAFTGAVRDRTGRFELADGGTIFLDEVGEIPLDMQGKLLRVLQEGTYERIGEDRTRSSSVRVIAATNRDLEREVAGGRFRQDLYYRLSVFPIEVIPLRERKTDIPLLVSSFLDAQSRKLGIAAPKVKRRHILELQRYDWPGNVRELQNVIERALILSRTGPLRFELPRGGATRPALAPPAAGDPRDGAPMTEAEIRQLERDNMVKVLDRTRWRISGRGGAAEYLGIHPATLTSRLKALGIARPP